MMFFFTNLALLQHGLPITWWQSMYISFTWTASSTSRLLQAKEQDLLEESSRICWMTHWPIGYTFMLPWGNCKSPGRARQEEAEHKKRSMMHALSCASTFWRVHWDAAGKRQTSDSWRRNASKARLPKVLSWAFSPMCHSELIAWRRRVEFISWNLVTFEAEADQSHQSNRPQAEGHIAEKHLWSHHRLSSQKSAKDVSTEKYDTIGPGIRHWTSWFGLGDFSSESDNARSTSSSAESSEISIGQSHVKRRPMMTSSRCEKNHDGDAKTSDARVLKKPWKI